MMICVISLFLIMSSAGEQTIEKSFIIVDKSYVYILAICNGTELLKQNHNMTDGITYINAKTLNEGFMVVFGGRNFGFSFIKTDSSVLDIQNLPLDSIATSLFPHNANTIYITTTNGSLSTYTILDGIERHTMSAAEGKCMFNLKGDLKGDYFYCLTATCGKTKAELLTRADVSNIDSESKNISETVIKMEIDFRENEIFAISKDDVLMKGKLDFSKNIELQAFRNVKQKVIDFAVTPLAIYYIEKNSGSLLKVKRTDDVESVPVFEKTKFDKPSAIVYLDFPGQDCEEFPKSFTTAIRSHWSFYFGMFLFTLKLWKS